MMMRNEQKSITSLSNNQPMKTKSKPKRAVSRAKKTMSIKHMMNWHNINRHVTDMFNITESRYNELISQIKHPYPVNSHIGVIMAIADVKFNTPEEMACIMYDAFAKMDIAWHGAVNAYNADDLKSYVQTLRIREYSIMASLAFSGYDATMHLHQQQNPNPKPNN